MPIDESQYVPQAYEILPYNFVQLLRYHRGETTDETRSRLNQAATILRDRAKHLTTLSREQGQQSVRDYAHRLVHVAKLLSGPPIGYAIILPGTVDLSFRIDPSRESYRIYVARRRIHRKHDQED